MSGTVQAVSGADMGAETPSQSDQLLYDKLSLAISSFGAQLGSSTMGTLTQAWVPEADPDGSIVLNTQGLPFCVNGAADLLALFRCISCKYKFSTDTTKPDQMGAIGRVYTSGEPELTRNIQQYDQSVYLRAAEAQRCHVNCCLFLPIYANERRDRVAAVLEVVQSKDNEQFIGLIEWCKVCLQSAGLYTIQADGHSLNLGLRAFNGLETSAFESKIEVPISGDFCANDKANNTHRNNVKTVKTTIGVNAAEDNNNTDATMLPPAPPAPPINATRNLMGIHIQGDPSAASEFAEKLQNKRRSNNNGLQINTGSDEEKKRQHLQLNPKGADPSGGPSHSTLNVSEDNPRQFATSYGQGDRAIVYDDLVPHFNFSLREAAARMKISVTTLKRACRRLGLQRWPRRELAIKSKEQSSMPMNYNNYYDNMNGVLSYPHSNINNNLLNWTNGQNLPTDSVTGDQILQSAQLAAQLAAAQVGAGFASILPSHASKYQNSLLMNMLSPLVGGAGVGGGAPPSYPIPFLPDWMASMNPTTTSKQPPVPSQDTRGGDAPTQQTHSFTESLDILASTDDQTISIGNGMDGAGNNVVNADAPRALFSAGVGDVVVAPGGVTFHAHGFSPQQHINEVVVPSEKSYKVGNEKK